ncbi:hypothetical protein MS3_00009335 [Schistosoma haematobium]|uniref:Uncharacterized protein n=1 Tax=Schistosoma haematobium TaxID=6185 RepID=A0A922IJV1_SCHHA|nr:hypothetical protein MS3_00009335 [Schistosoma haematobium]KAH9580820.1 hypothetical protein MS3_00009335 [Schistosoma haematobium]
MWLLYLCLIILLLGVIQPSQYENTFSDIYNHQRKIGLLLVLETYKGTLKIDEENLRNTTKQIGMLTYGINEKLSVKSLSINQYVDCMEKVLEVDNGIKQMQDFIHTMDNIERRYHVVYSKAPEWKKCYRKQSRIYRNKLPEVKKTKCNSYLKSSRKDIIDLISLMKSQRTYINQYNTDLLAHQFLLEIIKEIYTAPETSYPSPVDAFKR